uniref:CSON014898 protein n=1 Tax=Culicoides sonorensis TaxID=179676 RepID=A0A336KRR4_CULSO
MIPFKKLTILLSIACSVLAAPEGAREKDWWEIGNFYQVYPRSFMDSDGDGVGDLKGISEKVGYLKEIGMDGVWLSPIFDSPMADFGYDISNFTKVFPQFGDLPETFEMVTEWRATLEEFKQKNGGPTRVLMVEAYAPLTKVIQIYGQNGQLNGAQIPFNFEFLNNLGAVSNARDFKDVIDYYLSTIPEGATPNWVQGNHDQHRSASRLGPQKADAVNMLLQVLPGAAVTYYGEELAMEDVFVPWSRTVDPQACTTDPNIFHAKSRDPARTPMIWTTQKNAGFSNSNYTWLPTGPDYRKNNVEVQRSQRGSHLNIFKKLTQLRKQDILMYGTYDSYLANDDVLVIKREIENNRTLIAVLNLGFTEQVVNLNLNDRDWKVPERMEVATASVNAGMFERQPVVTSEVYVAAGVGVVLDYQVGRQIPEPRGDDPGLYD